MKPIDEISFLKELITEWVKLSDNITIDINSTTGKQLQFYTKRKYNVDFFKNLGIWFLELLKEYNKEGTMIISLKEGNSLIFERKRLD